MTAIIPVQLSSQRIKHKNMVKLGKYPLVMWTIKAAIKSKLLKRICIVTDDPEIITMVLKMKDERLYVMKDGRPDRSEFPPGEFIIQNVLTVFPKTKYVVFMQCTSPFRDDNVIDKAINKLKNEKADSLYFGCPIKRWLWCDNKPINYDYKKRILTQDKAWDIFIEGGDYVFTADHFRKTNCRLGGKIIRYDIDQISAIDIDDYEDLEIARGLV